MQYSGNAPEIDHIFPRAVLRDRGYLEEEINTVANYWILAQGKNRNKSDKAPSRYFADVDEQTLDRAAIDTSLLMYSRYRRFLRSRTERLAERILDQLSLSEDEVALLTATTAVPDEELVS